MLTLEAIKTYRAVTFRTRPELRVRTREEAVAYVNARGFVTFWPIKAIVMPSLWAAVAGDRPVPKEHTDAGHVIWGWKDSLLGQRAWYYAKVLRRKATMISFELLPYFYALSENYGEPELDYLDSYRDGRMTLEAKLIYEALLREGPMHTLALRRAVSMSQKGAKYRFTRGLEELEANFNVLPVGVAEAGAWRYAFIYDCVHRRYPELPELARPIGIGQAQETLVTTYLRSVGAVRVPDIIKVFQWPADEVTRTLARLVDQGKVISGVSVEDQPGEWVVWPPLLDS